MAKLNMAAKGLGFIILNIIRACNIIVLTIIAISSAVLMIVAKMPNAFTFFSDISMAFIIVFCFFLGLSEIGVWGRWIGKNWPAFGPLSGLTWLGLAMVMMGSHILGKLSDDRFTQAKMGAIFWNVCMAAGILSYIFGAANVFTSWWFGKRQGRNIRTFRNTGATEPEEQWKDAASDRSRSVYASTYNDNRKSEKTRSIFNPFGKGKKPKISGPMEVEQGLPTTADRSSPIMPEIQRPPTFHHPAVRRGSFTYSTASGPFV